MHLVAAYGLCLSSLIFTSATFLESIVISSTFKTAISRVIVPPLPSSCNQDRSTMSPPSQSPSNPHGVVNNATSTVTTTKTTTFTASPLLPLLPQPPPLQKQQQNHHDKLHYHHRMLAFIDTVQTAQYFRVTVEYDKNCYLYNIFLFTLPLPPTPLLIPITHSVFRSTWRDDPHDARRNVREFSRGLRCLPPRLRRQVKPPPHYALPCACARPVFLLFFLEFPPHSFFFPFFVFHCFFLLLDWYLISFHFYFFSSYFSTFLSLSDCD